MSLAEMETSSQSASSSKKGQDEDEEKKESRGGGKQRKSKYPGEHNLWYTSISSSRTSMHQVIFYGFKYGVGLYDMKRAR